MKAVHLHIWAFVALVFIPLTKEDLDPANLAFNKTTQQWPDHDSLRSSNAVNGNYSDFTHTEGGYTGHKWWRVDLGHIYNIAQIKLYNRRNCCPERLAKITVFTSTDKTPSILTVSFGNWTNRSYCGLSYPSFGVIDLKPSVLARHVAVYSANTAELSLAEVEVYAMLNLAYGKPATQSSVPYDGHANKAVNGMYDDYTHTIEAGKKWWMVNLQHKYSIARIELYNREGLYERLSQITVMTSNAVTPTNLSVSYEGWTNRSYQGPAYGAVGVIDFTSPTEAQHVAVVSENIAAPLSLAEVVVYDYNYALSSTSTQSYKTSSGKDNVAAKAIDGSLTTYSSTTNGPAGAHWWKVNFSKLIIFRHATIYVRNEKCGNQTCSSRLSDVYFLTNKDSTAVAPNTAGNGGWSICYHNKTAQGDSYSRACSRGSLNPVTRLFSIYTSSSHAVELREVEIYGDALPQLDMSIGGQTDSSTYTELNVSFNQWNQTMSGTVPPSRYHVSLGNWTKTVEHNKITSSRVSVQWTGLKPGKNFIITIQCQVEGVDCPEPQTIFTAMTKTCTAPDQPKLVIEAAKVTENGKQRWRYVVSWTEPSVNCYGEISYSYDVNGADSVLTRTTTSVSFLLDGNKTFNFTLDVVNVIGHSRVIYQNRSQAIAPNFGAERLLLFSPNSTCMNLAWSEPEYKGGLIDNYIVGCGTNKESTCAGNMTTALLCDFHPYTNVICYVQARNAAGISAYLAAKGITKCGAPAKPVLDTKASIEWHNKKRRWLYSVSWQVAYSGCSGEVTFRYSVGNILNRMTSTPNATFYLESGEKYLFLATVTNSAKLSSFAIDSGTAGSLDPGCDKECSDQPLLIGAVIGSIGLLIGLVAVTVLVVKLKQLQKSPSNVTSAQQSVYLNDVSTGVSTRESNTGNTAGEFANIHENEYEKPLPSCSSDDHTYAEL